MRRSRLKRRSRSSNEIPISSRSGYARERIARRLAQAELTAAQQARARTVVLSTVDGQRHCPLPGAGGLTGAVADNSLRRELRARLRESDTAVARRALRMVGNVRDPSLTAEGIAAARALVLADAARGHWLSPTVAKLAAYLCGWPSGRPSYGVSFRTTVPIVQPRNGCSMPPISVGGGGRLPDDSAQSRCERKPGSPPAPYRRAAAIHVLKKHTKGHTRAYGVAASGSLYARRRAGTVRC